MVKHTKIGDFAFFNIDFIKDYITIVHGTGNHLLVPAMVNKYCNPYN
ncbi:MAG: hypothetical protein HQK95_01110 [Nitrospirae bacterium]|nr:hypothetical protein [Nitrospirota bacterium]